MDEKIEKIKEYFHVYNEAVYVNHAAISPLSDLTINTIMHFWKNRSHYPVDNYEEVQIKKLKLKELISMLINSKSVQNIALTGNTSSGLSMVTSGYHWQNGDRIILNTMEFPSNIYPFLNMKKFGVEIDWITPVNGRITVEDIEKIVTGDTKMIGISFVQFLNGFRADLEKIGKFCRTNSIFLVVDGIQGVGAIPIDVGKFKIDALASGGHKWLMWPMGVGFLYVSDNLLKHLSPSHAGWLSVKDPWDLFSYNLDFLEGADRFETGTMNFMGVEAALKTLEIFLDIGIENIWKRIQDLTGLLIDGLKKMEFDIISPTDEASRSGIVSIKTNNPELILKKLNENGIIAALREGMIRFSPHCFNSSEDIKKILRILSSV